VLLETTWMEVGKRGGTREAFKNVDIDNQVKLRA